MKKTPFVKGVILSLISLAACTNDVEIGEILTPTDINTIEISAKDFEYDNVHTRTVFEITENGAEFTWAANDTIGIFPDEGRQVSFPMTSGAGTNKASFTGGGWALKASSTYAAYYPLVGEFYLDKEAIPVTYKGQTQTGNGSTAHLGDYDYMAALASTPVAGNVSFNFDHLGSLVRLKLEVPNEGTYTQLKLKCEEHFLINGSLNLSTQEITYSETSDTFILDLEGVTTTADNNTLELYLMLAPTDLSDKEITATIIDDKNKSTTTTLAGRNFVAGKAYSLSEKVENGTIVNVKTMGTLGSLLNEIQKDTITTMIVTGSINKSDFEVMKAKMPNLKHLDLKDVICENNAIPRGAFGYEEYRPYEANKTIEKLILPLSITSIEENAFHDCTGLKGTLELPKGLTHIGSHAFYNCSNLSGNLTIPSSVETIGDLAFYDCTGFSGFLTLNEGLKTIGVLAFCDCTGFIGELTLPNGLTSIGWGAFFNCSGFIGDLIIPEGVTAIGSSAFQSCNGFYGDLILPASLRTIGNSAFFNCSNLSGNLTIPSSVETIGHYAFQYCTGFSGFLTLNEGLKTIGNQAFFNCTGFIGELTLPNGLTSIGYSAFYNCSGFIGDLIIPEGVTAIGSSAFQSCNGFYGDLILPASLRTIGKSAFSSCSGFDGELTLPDRLTSLGQNAFSYCYNLKGTLIIPNGLISIPESAFYGCNSISGLVLGDNIATIHESAFYGCNSISGEVVFPAALISIRKDGFIGCSNVAAFKFPHTTPPPYYPNMLPEYSYGDMGDTEDPEYDPRSVVKVPTAAVATYQAANGWKDHKIVGY